MSCYAVEVINWILVLAIVGLLILVVLLGLKLRAMGRRLGQVIRDLGQLKKDHRAGQKDSRADQWEHYRQGETFAQLVTLLEITAPIPPTRKWAASPDLLLTLVEMVQKHQPKLIVELGSGISTLALAKSLLPGSQTRIISFDHSPEYAQSTKDLLIQHSITGVEIRVAPIEQYDRERTWYSKEFFKDLADIDMLVIDGPPGAQDPQARSGAQIELGSKLSKNAIVIIDDANREGEHAMAESFAQEMPSHALVFLAHEKGTALIAPQK